MIIRVSLDKVYGNEVIRPITKEAHLLCQLAGTKTFTQAMINTCKQLGYEFELIGAVSTQFSL
jgi:hypothetical protein